jgi:hypothetical protein
MFHNKKNSKTTIWGGKDGRSYNASCPKDTLRPITGIGTKPSSVIKPKMVADNTSLLQLGIAHPQLVNKYTYY